ncbi:MAG: hypothetical protein J6Y28_08690 [Acholeplasmatales bacterium]|nr:hypothetical protein [Acholeplasmatales bacterium]
MAVTGSWNNGGTSNPVLRTNVWGDQSYTLSQNEIYGSLFNLMISMQTFSDNLKGMYGDLAAKFKVDGSMYGDFKTYIGHDVQEVYDFTDPYAYNAEGNFQGNILKTKKAPQPKVQYVQIDQIKFLEVSLDQFLSKRMAQDEGAFSQFQSAVLGWFHDTKKVYEATLINAFVGTTVSNATRATINIPVSTARGNASSEEEANRLEASCIAETVANLLVDLKDISRDFTDWKQLRSYSGDDLMFVWNSAWVNKVKKIDLPTIFNKEGLMEKMEENILPARYFGHLVAAGDKGSGKVINGDGEYDNTKGTLRALISKEVTVSDTKYFLFPGDAIPAGSTVKSSGTFEENEVYVEDADVMGKVIHRSAVPFMSAYETETSFFNPRSGVTNHYMYFMYSNPTYLKNYPFLTLKKA